MADMSGLGIGMAGFAKGLQDSLALVGRQRQIAAQEEHIKHQTQLLKAQKLLTEETVKRKAEEATLGAKLHEAMLGKETQVPWSGEYGADVSMPQAPQTATMTHPPDLRTAMAIAARLHPQEFGKHIFDQAFPKPSDQKQGPVSVGPRGVYVPGQGIVGAPVEQPSPTPERGQMEPAPEGFIRIPKYGPSGTITGYTTVRDPRWQPKPEEENPTRESLEFQAEQKAIPFNPTDPEDRSAYAMAAGRAGKLTEAQVLQHTKTPTERVPLAFADRAPYEIYNNALKSGKPIEEALQLAEAERNRIRESGSASSAAGTAKGAVRADVPLKARDLLLFGKPVGTTYGSLVGDEPATPQMREEITQLDNAGAILDTLRGLADTIITAKTPQDALVQGAKLYTGAMMKTNEPAASYEDTKQMFLGVLSRTLGGERGVLTDRDITRVVRGLPGLRDTVAIKDFKLGAIRAILDVAVDAKMRVITGKGTNPEIRQRIEKLIADVERGSAAPQPQKAPVSAQPPARGTASGGLNIPPPSDVKMIGVHELSDGSRAYWDGKQWLNRKP